MELSNNIFTFASMIKMILVLMMLYLSTLTVDDTDNSPVQPQLGEACKSLSTFL